MFRIFITALSIAFFPVCASAKNKWESVKSDGRKAGIDYLFCKTKGEAVACLAIACRENKLELISARNGSGAYDGTAIIKVGNESTAVEFKLDKARSEYFEISASSANIDKALISKIVGNPTIQITDDNFLGKITTKGLSELIISDGNKCKI